MGKKGGRHNNVKSHATGDLKVNKVSQGPSDDSFIVFSNSKKESKPNKLNTSTNSPATQDPHSLLGDAPKRPDVKKLIGGASWTGKLPVNMLSEHCQKQKWEKPEYTMASYDLRVK